MSGGGAANKKRVSGRGQGWEEAGAEFYSESYPTGTDIELDVLQRDPSHIATLLPSKQSRATTTKHGGSRNTDTRTLRRRTSTRSRQSTARRTSTVNQDTNISMMPDLSENLSNEKRTWEEIMHIKAMPIPMYQKKDMKVNLQRAPYLRLRGYEQFNWQRRKAWRCFKLRWKDTYSKIEVWRQSLKKIEGNFGTGVVAYFLFIKWLMLLNLSIFTLVFLFIILPMIVFKNGPKEVRDPDLQSLTESCSDEYFNHTESSLFFLDFIQGTGWMEHTLLFYGFYTDKLFKYFEYDDNQKEGSVMGENVTRNDTNYELKYDDNDSNLTSDNDYLKTRPNFYYDLPLAYICITIIYFIISLVAIIKSAARGFKERLIEGEGQFYQYCNLIFGGWDFCIHNEKSAKIKHKALFNEIKGCLEAEKMEEEKQSRTRDEKTKLCIVRGFVNIVVLCILIGSGTLIYFVFKLSKNHILNSEDSAISNPNGTIFGNESLETLVFQFLPSISIVALNIIVPVFFKYLITFESYSPVIIVRLTLFRTVLLRLSSLAVLLVSLNYLVSPLTETYVCNSKNCRMPLCWETYVGQQIYKLVITDFATHLLITFIINFPRSLIARHSKNRCIKLIGEQEFDLPKHVLDVVYFQTLCWLGSFYAPMLPAIATIVCFLMFYIKKFACLVNSKPSSTVYRASRSNSLFMFVLLFSFVVAIIPVAYSIAELSPSRSCGPFRGLDTVWSLIKMTFMKFPVWIQQVLFFFGTAGFAVPVFIILVLMLYYYYAVSDANKHMVIVLKNQLVLEGHDKQFLLNRLSAFIKQQQEYQKKLRNAEMQRERDRASGNNRSE